MELDAPTARPARLPLIDGLRGVAILAMAIYHFSWDLRFQGFIAADVASELGWRIFARSIATSFLVLVGVGLVLSMRNGFDARRFLRRLGLISAAAIAITIVTRIAFSENYIFFGILHCIAVTSALGLPFVRAPLIVVGLTALLCLVAPHVLASPVFDSPLLQWIGLMTFFPQTNDYVPVLPWFAAVLGGIGAARLLPGLKWARDFGSALGRRAPRPLALAGRWSLAIYLIHQPLLFGLVYLAAAIAPPDLMKFEGSFLDQCAASCAETSPDVAMCQRTCACVAKDTQTAGLWTGVIKNTLGEAERTRYFDIAAQCQAAP